jgi:import inner membrane translocase subunit TIM54
MIFLSITGSWTAAVMYDRREKKRIQKKWATLVEHIAEESLDPQQLPRKLSVFIAAPPADGIVSAREHFQEYVKPILVAAALDWDAVEGRREGDVRAGLAERIRKLRQRRGERSSEPLEEGLEEQIEGLRQRSGVRNWDGPGGDIVIGRPAWKEYVRGLHEGWLGPLDAPVSTGVPTTEPTPVPTPVLVEAAPAAGSSADDASPTTTPEASKADEPEKPKEEEKPTKKKQPAPFNTTADYENSTLSPSCPRSLGPAAVIPFPHLLGFWNFPIRIYRYLNKRKLAEDIGRETAAAVLGAYRPFEAAGEAASAYEEEGQISAQWEQQRLLAREELDWHKSVRERKDEDTRERVWLDDMVVDTRIAERMKRFMLDIDAEERAKSIVVPTEASWLKSLWPQEKKKPMWEGLSDE